MSLLKPFLALDKLGLFIGQQNLGVIWLFWTFALDALSHLVTNFTTIDPCTLLTEHSFSFLSPAIVVSCLKLT
jgi:hypothetical protein